MGRIVTVNVNQTIAPAPSTLQRTGAIISYGGTNTGAISAALALASLTWASGVVTAATVVPHGIPIGTTFQAVIAGTTPAGYGGSFLATVTGASAFTYNLTGNPGAETVPGTWQNLSFGEQSLLTQASDLTPLLASPAAIASMTWASGVVTVTTAAPHNIPLTEIGYQVDIVGAVPAAYNSPQPGPGFNATPTGPSTFTFPLTVNPGAASTPGTWVSHDVIVLQQQVDTFFAQGAQQAVYVLELGICYPKLQLMVTNLTTFIANNPNRIYAYLVPRAAGAAGTPLQTYVSLFDSPTAKTYFFVTSDLANYASWLATQKGAFVLVESPATPASLPGEFAMAAFFQKWLSAAPSSTNKVGPFAFRYLFGVTPYPLPGNGPILQALENASINIVGTGAEGGIANTILLYGTTMDGNDGLYWYSVDWVQINADLAISNEIINGSNNPTAPLYYNQDGINRLGARVLSLMRQAIGDGLALGKLVSTQLDAATFSANLGNGVYAGNVVVNAEPFTPYVAENPNDYGIGKYGGITIAYTPSRGFRQVVINVQVSNFAGP